MVGFVTAVFAEVVGGAPVAEQLGIAPLSIGLVFALFTVASLVPILRVRSAHGWGRSRVWPASAAQSWQHCVHALLFDPMSNLLVAA